MYFTPFFQVLLLSIVGNICKDVMFERPFKMVGNNIGERDILRTCLQEKAEASYQKARSWTLGGLEKSGSMPSCDVFHLDVPCVLHFLCHAGIEELLCSSFCSTDNIDAGRCISGACSETICRQCNNISGCIEGMETYRWLFLRRKVLENKFLVLRVCGMCQENIMCRRKLRNHFFITYKIISRRKGKVPSISSSHLLRTGSTVC